MRVLWDYTIFQGVLEFFLKKQQNLLSCFAKVGMGSARTEVTDKKKRETSHKLRGGSSLASPKWLLLKLFPPVSFPTFPSSLPNRVLQAAGSGLHPKGSHFLHDPLTELPFVCFCQSKAGLGGFFPPFCHQLILWPSHSLRSHISYLEHLPAVPQRREHQLPVPTLPVIPAGAGRGVQSHQKGFSTRENWICLGFFACKNLLGTPAARSTVSL